MKLTLKVGPSKLDPSPHLFHEHAKQYLECRRSFPPTPNSPVPYALLCRAIELELKARHLSLGRSRRELARQPYGHNLATLYKDLPSSQRTLTESEHLTLVNANNIYNNNKSFDYVPIEFVLGLKKFPNLSKLEQLAEKLIT